MTSAASTSLKQRLLIGVVVTVQLLALPVSVFAQSSDPSADSAASSNEAAASSEEDSGDTGSSQPTGADSNTYKYNESNGNWENDYYSWNPKTKQTSSKTPQDYSYNPSTGMWDTTEWVYHPESGKYEPNTKSQAQSPQTLAVDGSGPNSSNSLSGPGGTSSINNSGPNSNNTIDDNSSANGFFNLFFNGSISTDYDATSRSGDALVQGNTRAGNALSGDASGIANIINMLQSSWLDQDSDVAAFIASVDGDVYGDLFIDPNAIPYSAGLPPNANIDINTSANSAIDNDIDLTVESGSATVDSNTRGGSARSGDANAVVNLMNLINSSIKSGKSFLGVLNINGKFNGDILLPKSILDALIARSGPSSNNTINQNQNDNIVVTTDTNRTILNDVTTAASSGNALVSGNTTAGSATTGKANSNVNGINLVGQDIKQKNGLLVFINVLGRWLGLSIGPVSSSNQITDSGPNSNNTINSNGQRNISVDAEENSLINNDINVTANSGDATVSNNTNAGDATSGDANIGVNILNMIDSTIDVSEWFSVLFINVFGEWLGSFGIDTAAGDQKNTSSATNSRGNGEVFGFVENQSSSSSQGGIVTASAGTGSSSGSAAQTSAQLASAANPAAQQAAIQQGIDQAVGKPLQMKIMMTVALSSVLAATVMFIIFGEYTVARMRDFWDGLWA